MTIYVNGEPETIPADSSLSVLLQQLALQKRQGMAVAVNEIVIGRQNWNSHQLKTDDKILIITATQGG